MVQNIVTIEVDPQKIYSEEEYLELEREADYKSEYYRGRIMPMNRPGTGGNLEKIHDHNRITENLSIIVGSYINGTSCRSYSRNYATYIPLGAQVVYPDLIIICGKNEFKEEKKDVLLNPSVIVEVLSASTSGYDRGEKFHFYRSIPSLQEYAIIDSLSVGAEVWRKSEEGIWYLASEAYDIDGSIEIKTVDVSLKLTDIYAGTEDIIPANQ